MTNANTLPLTVSDLVWVDDLDQFARETTSDLQALVQDVYHSFLEQPGENLDVPDRGIGILTLLSGTVDQLVIAKNRAEQQLPLDPRIDAATCVITQDPDGGYDLQVTIMVDGSVIGIALDYTASEGLSLVGWGPQ